MPLEIKNLSFSYNKKNILNDITQSFEGHKVTSIIGPNGSGKTTLLKNISKQLKIEDKKIFLDSADINDMTIKNFSKNLSVVNQHNNITFNFTVRDIVLMGRTPHIKGIENEKQTDKEIAEKYLKLTGTYHLKDSYITQISGGELQKVIIARALTQETKYLLLDEPISMLDIKNEFEIMSLIKNLSVTENITILIVLHDLNLAAQFSDNIILLSEGEIYKYGNPWEVITEKNISDVYGVNPKIVENPKTGKPHLIYYSV